MGDNQCQSLRHEADGTKRKDGKIGLYTPAIRARSTSRTVVALIAAACDSTLKHACMLKWAWVEACLFANWNDRRTKTFSQAAEKGGSAQPFALTHVSGTRDGDEPINAGNTPTHAVFAEVCHSSVAPLYAECERRMAKTAHTPKLEFKPGKFEHSEQPLANHFNTKRSTRAIHA